MSKKNSLLIICLTTVVVSAVAFVRQTQSKSSYIQIAPKALPQPEELPEHVPYMFLFHHIRVLKEQTEEIERQDKGKSALLVRFKEETSLDDNQFQMLTEAALDCERKVAALDEKAQIIIDAFRVRYPPGTIAQGVELPPPPPELIAMQRERDAIILRARDYVRRSLGEQSFARFHTFVQMRIASKVKSTNPSQALP